MGPAFAFILLFHPEILFALVGFGIVLCVIIAITMLIGWIIISIFNAIIFIVDKIIDSCTKNTTPYEIVDQMEPKETFDTIDEENPVDETVTVL